MMMHPEISVALVHIATEKTRTGMKLFIMVSYGGLLWTSLAKKKNLIIISFSDTIAIIVISIIRTVLQ